MKRIAVLASGGGTNFQAVLDACEQGRIAGRVVCLIYNRREAFARQRAQRAGVPAYYISLRQYEGLEDMQAAVHERLCACEADIVVLAGYLLRLGPQTVRRWRGRIVNTHPALIPSFCGQGFYGERVHQAVLDYGAKVSGCTIHLVDEQYDTGPILLQEAVPVLEDDDAHTLAARILPVEHRLLVQAVALLCDDRVHVEGRRVTLLPQSAPIQ
ncbi:MAG: phosphoribosylglycinamide formyltransferase [Clostridiales bacterium]|nr:phosphoribosylglycinamide formyltransferase [Clostridiales bacterium]